MVGKSATTMYGQERKVDELKNQLEQHYRRELDLIYEVLQLSDDEIHELLGWFATNPVYQGLKEGIDGIREYGQEVTRG